MSVLVRSAVLSIALFVPISACGDDGPQIGSRPDVELSRLLPLFGLEVRPWPCPSPEEAALGRALFHARELSANGGQSCNDCHVLARAGQDGRVMTVRPTRSGRQRNVPTVFDVAADDGFFRDWRARDLQTALIDHLTDPGVLGHDSPEALTKCVARTSLATSLGADVFPELARALAAYLAQLRTRSRFDDFLAGDLKALSSRERKGLALFVEVGCAQCHMSRNLGGTMEHRMGTYCCFDTEDPGRAGFTGNPEHQLFFKVPSLRNVTHTGPYLHDGSMKSLGEVVRWMARWQNDRVLTDTEVEDLCAFLAALAGERLAYTPGDSSR